MKIDKIKKLILEKKGVTILTGQQGQQWIGQDVWMVRVDEGLRITADSIKGLFDFSEEQMDKIRVEECLMESYPLWPVMRRDINVMATGPLNVDNFGGIEMLIFGNAVYLLEQKYIRACIAREDYREYNLGWDEGNNPVIIIRDGFIFAGIARPMQADVCKMLLEQMAQLSALTPGGTRAPENGGPLKLEPEGGHQLDMDEFTAEAGDDGED